MCTHGVIIHKCRWVSSMTRSKVCSKERNIVHSTISCRRTVSTRKIRLRNCSRRKYKTMMRTIIITMDSRTSHQLRPKSKIQLLTILISRLKAKSPWIKMTAQSLKMQVLSLISKLVRRRINKDLHLGKTSS